MTSGRCVEHNRVILILVDEIADHTQCGNFVNTGRSEFHQLPHCLAIKFDLQFRSRTNRSEQLVGPRTIALLQIFKPTAGIDLHRIQIAQTCDSLLQWTNLLVETI